MPLIQWTEEERNLIKQCYPWRNLQELADEMGVTKRQLRDAAFKLKIKRLPHHIRKRIQGEWKYKQTIKVW